MTFFMDIANSGHITAYIPANMIHCPLELKKSYQAYIISIMLTRGQVC
jgi:hypothetical protein